MATRTVGELRTVFTPGNGGSLSNSPQPPELAVENQVAQGEVVLQPEDGHAQQLASTAHQQPEQLSVEWMEATEDNLLVPEWSVPTNPEQAIAQLEASARASRGRLTMYRTRVTEGVSVTTTVHAGADRACSWIHGGNVIQ